jgi:hypothetical protein
MSEDKISEVDYMSLELAKANRRVALANAEKALAESKVAETEYKYAVLQIFHKYGLGAGDSIEESTGKILKAEDKNENK